MKKKLTRNATCGSLGLPQDLACEWCKPSISRALKKGIEPKRIKKCVQPWALKWGNHRELRKVIMFEEFIYF